jgi:hypothetical protein
MIRALLLQFCLVLALAVHAGSAAAQQAEPPDVKVGDRWQFVVYYTVPSTTPNRTWEVTAIGAVGIEGTENGEPLLLTSELNVLDSPRDSESNPQALSFPLEVGKRWRYTSDWVFKPKGSRGSALADVAVVAHEKIRVPAGEFDAFKLEAKLVVRGIAGIGSQVDGEITRTYWYAPAARAIVKSVSRNPYLGPSTVELVEFRLQP